MVSTLDVELNKKLGYLRSHGVTSLIGQDKGRAITYDVAHPGLNYRMDGNASRNWLCAT